jgi:hypothetical protein
VSKAKKGGALQLRSKGATGSPQCGIKSKAKDGGTGDKVLVNDTSLGCNSVRAGVYIVATSLA